ncbi:uncharacterized protein LOC144180310 [Haemaphysalis longicornis]
MLRGSCRRAWLFSLLAAAVCWTTGSALGSYLQGGGCNGRPCRTASQARKLCEMVSKVSPCNVDLQLCCLKFRVPHLLRTVDNAYPYFGESASSSRAHFTPGSSRQPRSIYVNILTAVLSEAIRAAIAAEYRDREGKLASANATEQYGPNTLEENETTSAAIALQTSNLHGSPQPSVRPPTRNSDATEPETTSTISTTDIPQENSSDPTEVTNPTLMTTSTASELFFLNVSSSGESSFAPTTNTSSFSTWPASNDTASPTDDLRSPCPGTCVPSFLSWFCEYVDSDYGCPGGGACCMATPTTTTPAPVVRACPGTCLHHRLTGLCKRPARLLLKTTTCGGDSICCTDTPRIW